MKNPIPYTPLASPSPENDADDFTKHPGPVWVIGDEPLAFGIRLNFNVIEPQPGTSFLTAAASEPGCIILNIDAQSRDGMSLLDELRARHSPIAVIFVSSRADIRTAVTSLQAGAVNFLEKPVDPEILTAAVEKALEISRRRWCKRRLADLVGTLSAREHQVFELICQGKRSNEIAADLFLSQRTVEVHRAHIMHKVISPIRVLYEMSLANDDGLFDLSLDYGNKRQEDKDSGRDA